MKGSGAGRVAWVTRTKTIKRMLSMKSIRKCLLSSSFVVVGCLAGGVAQAGTLATVIVENQTSSTATYTYEYFLEVLIHRQPI